MTVCVTVVMLPTNSVFLIDCVVEGQRYTIEQVSDICLFMVIYLSRQSDEWLLNSAV